MRFDITLNKTVTNTTCMFSGHDFKEVNDGIGLFLFCIKCGDVRTLKWDLKRKVIDSIRGDQR